MDGAVTLMGVKYTTARAAAEQAVTLATAQLGHHAPPQTGTLALTGAMPSEVPCPVAGIDAEAWRHLQRLYGQQASGVASVARGRPDLAARLVPVLPIIGAQVIEAVRNEMAMTLEDVVLRRTGIGSAGYPGDDAVLRVETILREELGWTSARSADEVQTLKEFYLPAKV